MHTYATTYRSAAERVPFLLRTQRGMQMHETLSLVNLMLEELQPPDLMQV